MSVPVVPGRTVWLRNHRVARRAVDAAPAAAAGFVLLISFLTHRPLVPVIFEAAATALVVRFGIQNRSLVAVITRAAGLPRTRSLELIVRGVLGVVLLWVVGTVVLWPDIETARYSPSATSGYSPSLVLLLALAGAVSALPAWRLAVRLGARWSFMPLARRRTLLALGVGPILALQMLVAVLTARIPAFDAGAVLISAQQQAVTGQVPSFIDWYYSTLPNNMLLGFLFERLFGVLVALGVTSVEAHVMSAVLLNALALALAAVLTLRIAVRLGGAALALLLAPLVVLFVVFSPWLNTPYSDTLGLLAVAGLVLLLLRWSEMLWRRPASALVLAGGIGALSAVTFALKPTTVLIVGAWLAVDVIRRPPSRRSRTWGAVPTLAVVAAAFLAAHVGILVLLNTSGIVTFDLFHNRKALPFSHLMVMGSHGLGGYNGDDVTRSLNVADPSARSAMDFGLFAANVDALGPAGYVRFLALKVLWMLGDGAFFQGREGDAINAPYLITSDFAVRVQRFFQYSGAASHVLLSSVWQAAWLLVLTAAGLGALLRTPIRVRAAVTALRLGVVLLLAFLLLSEGRSRYFYLDVPVFLLLAGLGVAAVEERVRLIRRGKSARFSSARRSRDVIDRTAF